MNLNQLVLYCRPGFENDCAAEVQEKAAAFECFGFIKAQANQGYVVFQCQIEDDADVLAKKLKLSELIFSRQLFCAVSSVTELPQEDRIAPILEAIQDFPVCGEVRVETADTDEAKSLTKFCKKFTVPLRQALRKANVLLEKENTKRPILHVFFLDNQTVLLGYSYSYNSSAQHMGITRLKFPADAPSRSTLKLEEAFHTFVPREEWQTRLTSGLNAVDLGACPGGWTYQLVKRGMMVQAVDNGQMDQKLMDTGQVKHFLEDGFRFQPSKRNIHWLVCDMVEKPQRVAKLMGQWVADGWCKEAIFNLKLPMKKRFAMVQSCFEGIHEIMLEREISRYQISAKQLYHDRDEITVHLSL